MPFLSDAPITSVVIAGAGGFGLEVFDYLQSEAAQGGPAIAGFIDDTPGLQIPADIDKPLLGDIGGFRAAPGQVVVVAIGSVKGRKAVLAKLWANAVPTPAFLAPHVVVSPCVTIERGAIICPFSIISRNARVGEGVLVNVQCSVAHGAVIGRYSVLCPYSALNGDATVGEECFLGTRATIYPRTLVGDSCVVDSHTGVRVSAGDKKMISSRGTYQVSALRVF